MSVEPDMSSEKAYNERLQAALKNTVFNNTCRSVRNSYPNWLSIAVDSATLPLRFQALANHDLCSGLSILKLDITG